MSDILVSSVDVPIFEPATDTSQQKFSYQKKPAKMAPFLLSFGAASCVCCTDMERIALFSAV
jgi:hypothetical protein